MGGDCIGINNFPRKFQLKSNWISVHDRLTIKDMNDKEIGSYHKELISLHDHYHLNNEKGDTIAECKTAKVSIGKKYEITNKENKDEYEIHEKKISSMMHLGDVFSLSKNGEEIGYCQKTEFLHETIDCKEFGRTSGRMKKSWLGLHDHWKISVKDTATIPAWVIGFLATIVQLGDVKIDRALLKK